MMIAVGSLLFHCHLSGFVSSMRRAFASGPGIKSRPGAVSGLVTIIMWGARPG